MRVLVTGAAGFIGSHLCEALAEEAIDIVAVDCLLPDSYSPEIKKENSLILEHDFGVAIHQHDLREPLPDHLWEGVTTVVNLAAMPGLAKSWTNFHLYLDCNVFATQLLIESAMAHSVSHFIQASTSSVYGRHATGSENDPLLPVSPYGVSKLAAENVVASYGKSKGLQFSILRYFSVYGPRQRPDMAYHIICERLITGDPVVIFGDGSQTRSNTYVDDAVDATVRMIHHAPIQRPVNVAGGDAVSLLEAVRILSEVLNVEPAFVFELERPGDQMHTHGDYRLATELLGYSPQVPIGDGLERQAKWHQSLSR